eukprot:jgi/Ulvmu1/2433/UM134_0014.1
MTLGIGQEERRGIDVLVRQHQRDSEGLCVADVLSGLGPPTLRYDERSSDDRRSASTHEGNARAAVSAGRLRSRTLDWRHRSKRTSFDGMHACTSSDEDEPIMHLPEERWTLEDICDGRPDRGTEASPLDRVTGTFDTAFPAQLNTLSSAYAQIGIGSFQKRLKVQLDGSSVLDLTGHVGSGAQIELLPELLEQISGTSFVLLLANNALKPEILLALSQLTRSRSACACLDLSQNIALLSSPLDPTQSAAVAAFFVTTGEKADTATITKYDDNESCHSAECAVVPTALSALFLDACNIHHSAAEALATGLLQQCAYFDSTTNGSDRFSSSGEGAAIVSEASALQEQTNSGLRELHLEEANLDEAAMMSLLSPVALSHRSAANLKLASPLSRLRVLNVAGCAAAGRAMPALADLVSSSSCLEVLDVSNTGASSYATTRLCHSLWTNPALARLSLAGCHLTWPAALALALAILRHHPRLQLLDLQACKAPPWGLAVLLRACATTRGVFRSLNISGCRLATVSATPAASSPALCGPARASASRRPTGSHSSSMSGAATSGGSATGAPSRRGSPASGQSSAPGSPASVARPEQQQRRVTAATVVRSTSVRGGARQPGMVAGGTHQPGRPAATISGGRAAAVSGSAAGPASAAGCGGGTPRAVARPKVPCVTCSFPESADSFPAFLALALGETPGFVARGAISADVDTPGGVAAAFNCLSLAHTGQVLLTAVAYNGGRSGNGETSESPIKPLPAAGVFSARVRQPRAAESDGEHHMCLEKLVEHMASSCNVAAGHGPPARNLETALPSGRAMEGVSTGQRTIEHSVQLPEGMHEDLLEQLLGQWAGWDAHDPAGGELGSGGLLPRASGSTASAATAEPTGGCWKRGSWKRRAAMITTSEVWQKQVMDVLVKAGIVLDHGQAESWRVAGLPEWGIADTGGIGGSGRGKAFRTGMEKRGG